MSLRVLRVKKFLNAVFFFLFIFAINGFSVNRNTFSDEKNTYNVKKVLVATYSGIIIPIAEEYINSAIDKLERSDYDLMILRLDTPGGLDGPMRKIVKEILSSKKPIVVYVYPKGARAASAGVFITMASHIAVMSPSTNIGAAHPVMIGGGGIDFDFDKKDKKEKRQSPMEEKVLNDAKAYIKSICQYYKHRNVEWAVNAVTKSDSITSEEALKNKVVEFIAEDIDDLLRQINNFKLDKFGVIITDDVEEIFYFNQSTRQKFLSTITDPNIATLLMSIGVIGIFIELYSPGLILPGVVGTMSLVIALYAFETLTANLAGLALMLLGMIFLIAEIKVISYGLLTIASIVSFLLGATILFKGTTQISGVGVNMKMITMNIIGVVIIVLVIGFMIVRSQMRKVETGKEALIGKKAIARSRLSPEGKVLVEGELWDAVSIEGEIEEQAMVEVVDVEEFKLKVKKVG